MAIELIIYWALIGWYTMPFHGVKANNPTGPYLQSATGPYLQSPSGPYIEGATGPYLHRSKFSPVAKIVYILVGVGAAIGGGIIFNSYFPIDPNAGLLGLQAATSGLGAWIGSRVGQDLVGLVLRTTGGGSDLTPPDHTER